MDAWSRIRGALQRQPPTSTVPPAGARLGAALALLAETDDGDLELVYTRRHDDLANHPGQISFPGGRVEPGESVEEAALREAAEEVGLDPATASVLGRLPPFYIPPSRFWLQTVVARWDRPHPLVAAEAEVAEVLRVRCSTLLDPDRWRVVRSSTAGGWFWAWQLDRRHLLWGATAVATVALLDLVDPGWSRGVTTADLSSDREVRPWERESRVASRPGPARLEGMPEIDVDAAWRMSDTAPFGPARDYAVERAGHAVARAAARIAGPDGRVLVLVGEGGTGAVGLAAAAHLRALDRDVAVVRAREFAGQLPEAEVVVDALVGTGLSGPLDGAAHAVVRALRLHAVPIVSVDVPSGLDPERGLIGDAVSADVTVALARPVRGLFRPGLSPFVGDLYVADVRDGSLVRLVPSDGAA